MILDVNSPGVIGIAIQGVMVAPGSEALREVTHCCALIDHSGGVTKVVYNLDLSEHELATSDESNEIDW